MGKDSEKVAYFGRGGGVSTTDTLLWGYGISQALFGCVGSEKCSTAYAYSDAGAYCGAFGTGYGWVSVVIIDCKHYYPNMILPKYDCMLTFLFHFYSLVPSITNHHRIAFTGSGKTLSFSLPLVMAAMEEEACMPFRMIKNRNFKYVRDYNYTLRTNTTTMSLEGSIHIIVQQTLPVAGVEAASFAAAAASFAAVVASSIALRCCFINLAISSES